MNEASSIPEVPESLEKEDIEMRVVEDMFILSEALGCNPEDLDVAIWEAAVEAEKDILSLGDAALPIIRDFYDLTDAEGNYHFATWVYQLFTPEDLDFVLGILAAETTYDCDDGSALDVYCETLNRLSVALRRNDPNDARLSTIATTAITLLSEDLGSPFMADSLHKCLAMTGTSEASAYILEHVVDDAATLKSFISDVDHAERHLSAPPFFDFEAGLIAALENQNSTSEEDVANRELCASINTYMNAIPNMESTALAATKLYLYNRLVGRPEPSDTDIAHLLEKGVHLSAHEQEFSSLHNPLPTIGIEVECPSSLLTRDKVAVLTNLGIPNYREGNYLHEVNPEFSYSPWVQARILQELAMFGAIPLIKTVENVEIVDDAQNAISLHVNLGIPVDVEDISPYKEEFDLVTDALTYAYTSAKRIRERKTQVSNYTGTMRAKKSKKTEHIAGDVMRYEFRAGEFKDFPTYRMLVDAQSLTGMLFAHIRRNEGIPLDPAEEALANHWEEFKDTAEDTLHEFTATSLLYDTERAVAGDLIEQSSIQSRFRALSNNFSSRVRASIKEP